MTEPGSHDLAGLIEAATSTRRLCAGCNTFHRSLAAIDGRLLSAMSALKELA
jgi:hypothetical protein